VMAGTDAGTARLISKNGITALLEALIGEWEVLAPVQRREELAFEPITHASQAVLDFSNTTRPSKNAIFPPCEVLFRYDGQEVHEPAFGRERVVFAVRPCDARSFLLLDNVFSGPPSQDPYYAWRREHTYLVGLACNHPSSTCFCSAVGGGPFDMRGLDVFLTDLGEAYLAEPVNARGAAFLERWAGADSGWYQEADPSAFQRKQELARQAERKLQIGAVLANPLVPSQTQERLESQYEHQLWEALGQKCLGCGACTYLCPTCHCFDILDEADDGSGRRLRLWDCCQFPLFTLHTSGHNPRPSGKERIRQRIMHKFRYFVANYGEIACVGCGRCVRSCPVNIDLRYILLELLSDQGQAEMTMNTGQCG